KPRARPEAGLDLEADTARRPDHGEELFLIGEKHLLGPGAVAQPEPVVKTANAFTEAATGPKGAEGGQGATRGPRGQEGVSRRPAANANICVAVPRGLALDVETRPPPPDQLQLAQQRDELA